MPWSWSTSRRARSSRISWPRSPRNVRGDYVRAARMLGRLDVDVVLLQHEYGIFGGRDGEYVLSFAEELEQPLVVTLHTVLSEPTPHQLRVLAALCDRAELVIVMTDTAHAPARRDRSVSGGQDPRRAARRARRPRRTGSRAGRGAPAAVRRADARRVRAGAGALPALDVRADLRREGARDRNRGHGSHRRAAPRGALRDRRPHAPARSRVAKASSTGSASSGRVVDLGLDDHVEFDDRFLSVDELADLLAATDVFVTPYRNREQIASGALTFAIAAGCAVVSTPYWYAEDMLSSGAGLIVPFADPEALADAVCRLIEEPETLAAARAEARRIGSSLAWPSVAEATADVLREAMELAPRRTRTPVAELKLTDVRVDHLLTLVDDVGIVQHAHGVIPNRGSGYCVDDVARLAVVALELSRRGDERAWTTILYRALAFLYDATDERGAGMRNFMSYDRRWLDEPHVGDHVGRSVWALGEMLSTAWVPAVVGPGAPHARRARQLAARRPVPPHRAPTRPSASRGSTRTGSTPRRGSSSSGAWSSSPPRTRPPPPRTGAGSRTSSPTTTRASRTRSSSAARRSAATITSQTGLAALRWLGDECGPRRRDAPPAGPRRAPSRRARPGRRRRAAARRLRVRRGRARRLRGHRTRPSTARALGWRSTGSSAGTASSDRCTTSRRAAAATGSALDDLNANEGAESTLAFHRAALVLDAAGLPVASRRRAGGGRRA